MKPKKKAARIIVPYGMIDRLSKRFGCNRKTIQTALAYMTNSELANNIRKEAMKYYRGTEVELNV